MHRFYVAHNDIQQNTVSFAAEELHHLRTVLRLKRGDEILVLDGQGGEYVCEMEKVSSSSATAVIKDRRICPLPFPEIVLVQAIPRLERMEYILQKSVELGVRSVIPVVTQRTMISLADKTIFHKMRRWEKIVIESSKQCGRADLLHIQRPIDFRSVFTQEQESATVKLIGYINDATPRLKEVLAQTSAVSRYMVCIGPEGDFTQEEIAYALQHHCKGVSLGARVLRTDTAAIFMCTAIMYEWGK